MPAKPSVTDVEDFLRSRDALIVHFSGSPPGTSYGKVRQYPADLEHVIAGHAQGGLSCSLVMPSDNFSGVARNTTGCVGVVLRLRGPDSLIAVSNYDAGSWADAEGKRHFPEKDIAIADCRASLDHRIAYNEWGVRDYDVVAILAVSPWETWDHAPPGQISRTDIPQVMAAFPDLPVITAAHGRFWRLSSADDCYRLTGLRP